MMKYSVYQKHGHDKEDKIKNTQHPGVYTLLRVVYKKRVRTINHRIPQWMWRLLQVYTFLSPSWSAHPYAAVGKYTRCL